jgi:DNA-directed RNA polymerase specialized sigma24 family protein
MAIRKAQRSLTAEAFGKFLRWLSNDDSQAIGEYQAIRRKLVRYFIHKGCADPDELFDRTVDVVVGKIDSCGGILSQLAYCHGVARNIWRQSIRENRTVAMTGEFPSKEPDESGATEEELRCLEHCVSQLPPEQQELVTRYHGSLGRERIEARRVLAQEKGGSVAVRVRACRIRKELRLCVTDCLARSAKARFSGVHGHDWKS